VRTIRDGEPRTPTSFFKQWIGSALREYIIYMNTMITLL